jgi:hypothetical protein
MCNVPHLAHSPTFGCLNSIWNQPMWLELLNKPTRPEMREKSLHCQYFAQPSVCFCQPSSWLSWYISSVDNWSGPPCNCKPSVGHNGIPFKRSNYTSRRSAIPFGPWSPYPLTAMHHDFDVVSLTCGWYHGVLLWAVNLAYRWQRISIPW